MRLFPIILFLFFNHPANALEVLSARYDRALDKLLIEISYQGGCTKNEFRLALVYYRKSAPPQIGTRVIHTTHDECRKWMKSIEEFEIPKSLRGGDWFQILNDERPKNSSRPAIGLCIPECKKQDINFLNSKFLKKLKKSH